MMGILLELMRMNDPVQPVIRELLEMLIRLLLGIKKASSIGAPGNAGSSAEPFVPFLCHPLSLIA